MRAGPGGIVGSRVKLSIRGMVGCWQSLGKRRGGALDEVLWVGCQHYTRTRRSERP